MRTTPRSFYELFVQPNYWDYEETPDDVRRGFNAALSAFQLADVFYAFYSREEPEVVRHWPKLKDFHIHLSQIEPHFRTVQSVATVYKHLYATGGHYEVGSPGAVWGVSIPNEEIELESEWRGSEADVLVKRRDGTTVSLTLALRKVVDEMWPGVLPNEDRFYADRSRDAC
jgi:hypothetical protein